MAFVAAATNVGTRKQVNEDSCCIKVAQTSLGEVVMALVCDGVGGLSAGNLASATVVHRFASWFDEELPLLMAGMTADSAAAAPAFDFSIIRAVWTALLQAQNDLIYTHGSAIGARLGTTFTCVIVCGGYYLVGHVGDCRAYRLSGDGFEQLTEDQTKVARMLAAGEITPEEAKRMPQNVILQSVGTQRSLAPAFYEGTCSAADLFVICCDGAYHRVENDGIRRIMSRASFTDEAALQAACEEILQLDLQMGERDNLTAVCFCPAEAEGGVAGGDDDLPTMVESVDEGDDMPTMVETAEPEDDMPTMVEAPEPEDDLPTTVEAAEPEPEDDMPTMVEVDQRGYSPSGHATGAAGSHAGPEGEYPLWSTEDDLPTMVEHAEPEDDLPTMVEAPEPEDDLPTMVEPGPDEGVGI